jgi:DNA-directed RNA polymerase specialized sigma subunit
VRSAARKVENSTSDLEHELDRAPTIEEIATRTEMTVEEVHELRASLDAVPIVTFRPARTRAQVSPKTWARVNATSECWTTSGA